MAYESKPGDISVFRNDKGGVDNRPDYTGKVILPEGVRGGDELRVALWVKESAKGKFLSGRVQADDRSKRGPDAYDKAKLAIAKKDRATDSVLDNKTGLSSDDIPF